MENIMNNIDKETVDAAMEAVKDIDIENVPVQVIADAGIGKVGKVCLAVGALTAVGVAAVATYRFIKKKIAKAENNEIDPETAAEREAEAVDAEYTEVTPDEE